MVSFVSEGRAQVTNHPAITSITPSNAAAGSVVTLVGQNFGNSAPGVIVEFGGHAAGIQTINPSQIVAQLPLAVNGTVPVTVFVNGLISDEFLFQIQSVSAPTVQITSASLVQTNLRLRTEPAWPVPNALFLEYADSVTGPWLKESEYTRSTVASGQEFLTPRRNPQRRFFRVGATDEKTLPFIRYIAPHEFVRPGLSVTLLGANFAPTPAGNTVRFSLPSQSWTATVTEAGTNYLVVTVPMGIPTSVMNQGLVYRVTVTTALGTGNGVGCEVFNTTGDQFAARPSDAIILQPPGSGMETIVVGGGIPPYQLLPLTPSESNVVTATLNGRIVTVVAKTNVTFGNANIRVTDSSPFPQEGLASVYVRQPLFTPTLTSTFHTLLAGTAPGLTMTARFQFMQPAQMEVQFQNLEVELGTLRPGMVLGLVKVFYSSTVYGFQQLIVTETNSTGAKFDIVSVDEDSPGVALAHCELIKNPPQIIIRSVDQQPESVVRTTLDQEIMFSGGVLRLPATAGQNVSIIAKFTSVSLSADQHIPMHLTETNTFTTTGIPVGAPRLERLFPVHGEIRRNVLLRGSGFDVTPTNNEVTFAGVFGERVVADVLGATNGDLIVMVPRTAVSGPVRVTKAGLTGNDYRFHVRFHPEASMTFSSFSNNMPTAFRLSHQQPLDDGDTLGEVGLKKLIATLDQGNLAMTGVLSNQQVGTVSNKNFYSGSGTLYPLVYMGQEPVAPNRHRFDVPSSLGSTLIVIRLFAMNNTNGAGVTFETEGIFLPFNPGIKWEYRFTTPIYRPLATPNPDVILRLEAVSQQWMSLPATEMRYIENILHHVQ